MATKIYSKSRKPIERSDAKLDVLALSQNFAVIDDSELGRVLVYEWNADGHVEVVGTVSLRGRTRPGEPYVRSLTLTAPENDHHFLKRWSGVIPEIEDEHLVWKATGVEPDDHRSLVWDGAMLRVCHEADRIEYEDGRLAARLYAQEALSAAQFAAWELGSATGQSSLDIQYLSIIPVGSEFLDPWLFEVDGQIVCVPRHRHGQRDDAAAAVRLWATTRDRGVPEGVRAMFDPLEQLLRHIRNLAAAEASEPKTPGLAEAIHDLRRSLDDVIEQISPRLPMLEDSTKSSAELRKVWTQGSSPLTLRLPDTHPLWRYDGTPRILKDWRAIDEALGLNPFSPPEDEAEVDEWDEWTTFEPLWAFNGQLWRAPAELEPEAFVQAIDRRWSTTLARTLLLWPDVVYELSAPERAREEAELIARAEAVARERKHLSKLAWAKQVLEDTDPSIHASQTGLRKREPIPSDVQRAVFDRDGGACIRCETRVDLQFDHIIPHSLGGSNSINNVQLLCGPCNRRKSATIGG